MPADCSKWTVVKQPKITTLRGLYAPICLGRAVSSVVEHYLDTVGVTGSNPVSRTITSPRLPEALAMHDRSESETTVAISESLRADRQCLKILHRHFPNFCKIA